MKQQVAITAVGVVSALGATLDGVREGLFRGDQGGIVRSAGLIPGRECFVASVREVLPTCPKGLEKMWSRNVALTLMALRQIEGRVAAAIDKYGRDRIAIVIGSSTSGISEVESVVRAHCEGRAAPAPYNYRQQQMGTVSLVLSQVLGVVGPSYTISTACSSSGKVFRAARNLLRAGLADCVITGGIDSLCGLTIQGFSSLQLVSDHVTNPFSKNRSGITIGEAAALFVLERSDVVSGERPVIVRGVGESSDAYHISSPDPCGFRRRRGGRRRCRLRQSSRHGHSTQRSYGGHGRAGCFFRVGAVQLDQAPRGPHPWCKRSYRGRVLMDGAYGRAAAPPATPF
jgi:3-oxoacyl-[acyl-carrier-protein] synthase-1